MNWQTSLGHVKQHSPSFRLSDTFLFEFHLSSIRMSVMLRIIIEGVNINSNKNSWFQSRRIYIIIMLKTDCNFEQIWRPTYIRKKKASPSGKRSLSWTMLHLRLISKNYSDRFLYLQYSALCFMQETYHIKIIELIQIARKLKRKFTGKILTACLFHCTAGITVLRLRSNESVSPDLR